MFLVIASAEGQHFLQMREGNIAAEHLEMRMHDAGAAGSKVIPIEGYKLDPRISINKMSDKVPENMKRLLDGLTRKCLEWKVMLQPTRITACTWERGINWGTGPLRPAPCVHRAPARLVGWSGLPQRSWQRKQPGSVSRARRSIRAGSGGETGFLPYL